MDDNTMTNTTQNHHGRSALAFTLIELLTVITIMGIIAAMVVTMGQSAAQQKKKVAVEGNKNKLINLITDYQNKLNYYPPDNGALAANVGTGYYEYYAATNPLIYELTGATNTGNGANLIVFNTSFSEGIRALCHE
jgi:prepilin-type N-terminal cleavage/methylation domain-containing protein